MFPDAGVLDQNYLLRASESIRTGNHTHKNLMNMKRQSISSPSKLQNAKAKIIDYYMSATMTQTTEITLPEAPKVSTDDKQLTDLILCRRYVELCENAIRRGIQFSLSVTDVRSLLKKNKCHYTGLMFDHSNPDFRPSFDRIDRSQGYTKENVVVCMTAINHLKNDLLEKSGALFLDNHELLLKTIQSICKTVAGK